MGATKRLFEKFTDEDFLGLEARAELHWMEQEFYDRYPKRKNKDDKQ